MGFNFKSKKYFLIVFFLLAFTLLTVLVKVPSSLAETDAETKIRLQAELADLEKQIAEQQKIIASTQSQSASLSRDISLLQAKINQKQLEIKKTDNNIYALSSKIIDKNVELGDLSSSLDKQRLALANALRNMYKFDGTNNFLNLLLDNQSLSQFFEEADKTIALQGAINQDVGKIKDTTTQVNKVKGDLEESKDTQMALKEQQQSARNKIDDSKKEKNNLLTETKGKEAIYKEQLKEKQAKAAEIRAALFSFAGGETKAIPFGTALQYAENASDKTGVPAALVLAILTQESALGANVGKCYLSDTESGAGYNINSKQTFPNVMKASRDVSPFLTITKRLGLDPLSTVVSCPIPSAGGYGGAMGPAQFIPSTWMDIEDAAGISNPWNASEAILASSFYLSQLGANSSYASQIKAACKYYGTGGSSCSYGRSVMSKVDDIQSKIDYVKQYGG